MPGPAEKGMSQGFASVRVHEITVA